MKNFMIQQLGQGSGDKGGNCEHPENTLLHWWSEPKLQQLPTTYSVPNACHCSQTFLLKYQDLKTQVRCSKVRVLRSSMTQVRCPYFCVTK